MLVGVLPDQFLLTLNGIELLGIIYLAIAVSKLRSDVARLEGRQDQRDQNHADRD